MRIVTFEANGDGTRMTVVSRFVDAAQMKTMLDMGMAEGMTQAVTPDRRGAVLEGRLSS